jgi:hypothetical protein
LDWDAPISQQSPQARKALADAMRERGFPVDPAGEPLTFNRMTEPRGKDLIANLASSLQKGGGEAAGQRAMAEELRKRGIPGIKYLDGGSRGAGEGTRNYVIWDESLVQVLRKFGVALGVIEGLRRQAASNGGRLDADTVHGAIQQ